MWNPSLLLKELLSTCGMSADKQKSGLCGDPIIKDVMVYSTNILRYSILVSLKLFVVVV